jgi:hypothetical protein
VRISAQRQRVMAKELKREKGEIYDKTLLPKKPINVYIIFYSDHIFSDCTANDIGSLFLQHVRYHKRSVTNCLFILFLDVKNKYKVYNIT